MKRVIALLLFVLLLSGCAFGRKISYEGRSNFNIQPESQKVIVAVHDMRPYIQDNDRSPDFVGIQQSIAGVPYNVTTKSGKPLADDLGMMIVNTLNYRKVSATQQEIPYLWSFADFKEKVLGKEKDSRVYYIKMLEWKTVTHFRIVLDYDLQLLVFDDQANEVANNEEKGSFYLDKDIPRKENLSNATADILGKLFAVKESNKLITDSEKDVSFRSLPPKVKDEIKRKCAEDYPEDFAMQADCAGKQAKGWLQLNK